MPSLNKIKRYTHAISSRIKFFYEINELDIESSGLTKHYIPYVKLENGFTFYGYLSSPLFDLLYVFLIKKRQKNKLNIKCSRVAFDIVFRFTNIPTREFYSDYKSGDIVLEIGAYIGYFVLYAAKLVKRSGLVIGIEPVKENFYLLNLNVEAIPLNNIKLVNKATWDTQGILRFQRQHRQRATAKKNVVRPKEGFSVPCDTVDNILTCLGVNHVDFIRIQVNGAELETLKGMTGILKQYPKLSVANMYVDKNTKNQTVTSFLNRMGYTVIKREGSIFAYY
jgi:FkbM family methyltransferase